MIASQPTTARIMPLGGLGEIGMNCLALEQRGEILLIDCGVTFDDRGLGVDVVHPDFTCLAPFRDKIAGVFLTHGHEDHIGALPYLLRQFDVPVWGPAYAIGLLKERRDEHEVLAHTRFTVTATRQRYAVGSFEVEPIRVTHSIADATALAVRTDAGMVVHTGDFKFDESPPDGEAFDVERLTMIANDGVALLLSDSTNIDSEGKTGSESGVGEALEHIILGAKGRVVVAMFASNVHRLKLLGGIAHRTGRKIVPLGRSVHTHRRVAHATGYLAWPDADVVAQEQAAELPPNAVLGIATGTQAEANAALARISRGEHPFVVGPGDVVIMSSRIIPGHEPEVYALMGNLLRRGIEVRTRISDRGIHVSGHATRVEQLRMIEMIRPKAFVPLHGTLHHLSRHAELARQAGVASVCILENGDVATLSDGAVNKTDRWSVGRTYVGFGRAVPSSVLRERLSLAAQGIAVVIVPIDSEGQMIGQPHVFTRGVLDEVVDLRLLGRAKLDARSAVDALKHKGAIDEALIAETARLAVRRALARELGYKPHVMVSVLRVAGIMEAAARVMP